MSEIKVGDTVRIYGHSGFRYEDKVTGVITSFPFPEKYIAEIWWQGKYRSDHLYAHVKQCRKLVKYKKCDECKGSGKYHDAVANLICRKCNGSGKVKI